MIIDWHMTVRGVGYLSGGLDAEPGCDCNFCLQFQVSLLTPGYVYDGSKDFVLFIIL